MLTSQLHQHGHHESIPLGSGGGLQVEGVGQDGAQQHARGALYEFPGVVRSEKYIRCVDTKAILWESY